MSQREVKDLLAIGGLIVTVAGALLGTGIWIGGYVKAIERNSAKACEFKLLHEMARKRASANNQFGNYVQNNLNVLSAKLNLKDGNTGENWATIIKTEREKSKHHKSQAERLYEEARLLGDELVRCSVRE